MKKIKAFFAKETVFCFAAACAVLTMFLVPPDREYLHYIDFRVQCLLMCLMAVIAGLKAIGIFRWLTVQLLAGVNIGGLATPIASLASLITIKFYMGRPDSRILRFLGCFTLVNVVMLAVVLFFAWMT